jgi:hypothetical protein
MAALAAIVVFAFHVDTPDVSETTITIKTWGKG